MRPNGRIPGLRVRHINGISSAHGPAGPKRPRAMNRNGGPEAPHPNGTTPIDAAERGIDMAWSVLESQPAQEEDSEENNPQPTAVAGLTLASLFSVNGFYGEWLAKFDIKVTYTWLGIAVAMAFTSIPFVVRTVQPVLEELGPEYEEAAETLGATRLQSFRKVVLPELSPALLAGVALSFTRSLGEFGAVIFIAGNIAWKTEVTSLMIFVRLQEFDYPAASAIASVILAASLLLLFSINTLQSRFGRRVVGH
ncbi:MAG: sulfate ABC transporter permease subunit [Kluyvera cryocrescens]|nr:sulfate ABC transporter permease subunit [Kluyvera cryocrescens]